MEDTQLVEYKVFVCSWLGLGGGFEARWQARHIALSSLCYE